MTSDISRSASRSGLAVVGMGAILALLTGCAVVDDLAHGRADRGYATADTFARDNPDLADWVPANATDIAVTESTRADDTVSVLLTSEATVLSGCEEVPRRSAPTMTMGDDIDVYALETVQLCGRWAVVRSEDRWLGWMPATEAEPVPAGS